MSKFITGKDLENVIYDIIWEVQSTLLIVSPFIKLDDYFKELFDKHQNNPEIHLILIFGKNENDVQRSMSKSDFDYFKKFLNVSIIYVPNLHAKYYGNERKGIITSINLYDYSFKNNIEFGVYTEQTILDNFKQSADTSAWIECIEIAKKNEVVFIKRPAYQNKKILISFGKKYIKSDILFDSTEKFYGYKKDTTRSKKHLEDFPKTIDIADALRPERKIEYEKQMGFCIRTGIEIPFNPNQPMSKSAWTTWNEYANYNFPENFCHSTGKRSFGTASMGNPIL